MSNKAPDPVVLSQKEVKEALRKMKGGKTVGVDCIRVEIWKSLGEEGIRWLTDFFNYSQDGKDVMRMET